MQKLLTTYPPFNNFFIFCTQWLLWTLSCGYSPYCFLYISLSTDRRICLSINSCVWVVGHFPYSSDPNHLHPKFSMHILHTVLQIPKELTRRIWFTIKNFFSCWSFTLLSWPYCLIHRWYLREKLDDSHSQVRVTKGFIFYLVLIL